MKSSRATEWVQVSTPDFDKAEIRRVPDGFVKVLPSPYDMPVAVRSVITNSGQTDLELRYLGSEPLAHGTYQDGSEIEFGRRSYRPYSIRVHVDASKNANAYIRKLSSALDSFFRVYAPGAALTPSASGKLRSNVEFIKAIVQRNSKVLTAFDVD